jgi:SAM-dependent methyltransferase
VDIDLHYRQAELYDQYYGEYAEPAAWLVEEMRQRGEVLELACGTGRLAIPLAARGLQVTGIDYTPEMLALAKEKAKEKSASVEWVEGDMRSFELGRKFGSVLLLSNALWHLHEIADFEACMRCVHRHLAPGGIFVLSLFIPALDILARNPDKRYPFSSYTDSNSGEEVQVMEQYRYEPDTQIGRVVHYKGDTDEVVGTLNLRMYFPKELDALLAYNDLRVLGKFGDWDQNPFGPGSNNQIYICEAAS